LTFPETATHIDNLEWKWIIAPAEDHETHD